MQKTVSFHFLSREDYEYQITARVTPGHPAPPQNFDRFREPDDPDEVEIIKVLSLDDYGEGREVSEAVFTDAEIEDIEAKACEEYHAVRNEIDYPDYF